MNIENLVQTCHSYAKLGWAVQEQLLNVVADPNAVDECNANALDMMVRDFLKPLEREARYAGDEDLHLEALELIAIIESRTEGYDAQWEVIPGAH